MFAQAQLPQGYYATLPVSPAPNEQISALTTATPLPLWTYSVTGYDNGTYSGTAIGRSPYSRGKATTTIPLQVIPLIITINNGAGNNVTYDPTAPDSCVTGGLTDVSVITGSPIFTNNTWTMNGVNVGNTQYIDAFQRAQYWSLVAGSPYHLIFNESTLSGQSLSFGSSGTLGGGTNYPAGTFTGQNCPVGVVNINNLDAAVQTLINSLSPTVNVGTFPMFLTKNVFMAETGDSIFSSCCVLGYHSGVTVGSNLLVYSPFSIDTTGIFGGGYVSTISHEIAEAVNDPTGNNPTPPWGAEGQVTAGNCQSNFEVGDPLSPGFPTPTNSFSVNGGNGLTYKLQELAFFNWFFGGTSLGAGGKYSNNGTFSGFAKACPPGGTN
jgi:hypothetical protein